MGRIIQLVSAWKTSCLQSAVMSLSSDLQTKSPISSTGWDHCFFAAESKFGVEEAQSCPIYMYCFKLQLPTDAEDVFMGDESDQLWTGPMFILACKSQRMNISRLVKACCWQGLSVSPFWEDRVLSILKLAVVQSALSKSSLDANSLASYCHISNLPFLEEGNWMGGCLAIPCSSVCHQFPGPLPVWLSSWI